MLKFDVTDQKKTVLTFDINNERILNVGLDAASVSVYNPWQQLSYFLTGECTYLKNGCLSFKGINKGSITFKHEQGSFYTKTPPLTEDEIIQLLQDIDKQMPYLKYCINDFQIIGDKVYSVEPAKDWLESQECLEYMDKIKALKANIPARNVKISESRKRMSSDNIKDAIWYKILNPELEFKEIHNLTGIGQQITWKKVLNIAQSLNPIVNGSIIDSKVLMGLVNELKVQGIDTEVFNSLLEYDPDISKDDLEYATSGTVKLLVNDLAKRYVLDKDTVEIMELDNNEDKIALFLDKNTDILHNTEMDIVKDIMKTMPGHLPSQTEIHKCLLLYLYKNPDKIDNIKLADTQIINGRTYKYPERARQAFINRIGRTVNKLQKETDKVKEEKERE